MAADNGELQHGQRYDPETDTVVRFTEQMYQEENSDLILGQARTDISPQDAAATLVRVWAVPSSALDAYFLAFAGTTNLDLPDVLTAIVVTYNKSSGDGESVHDVGDAAWVGDAGGLNLDPTSSASASAAIIPDIQPAITPTWAANVPTQTYLFYISGSVTVAQIITKLQTVILLKTVSTLIAGVVTTTAAHGLSVGQSFQFFTIGGASGGVTTVTTYFVIAVGSNISFTYSTTLGGSAASTHNATSGTLYPVVAAWPKFKPETHVFTLKGQQVSLSQQADSHVQYRWNTAGDQSRAISPYSGSRSDGKSIEVGVTVRTVQLPPTIHGVITLATTTDTAQADVTVQANVPGILGTGGAPSFDPITNEPASLSATVTGSITPTSLAATSGQASIPTANLYILDMVGSPYQYGYSRVQVTLVDFSYFA